MVQPILQIARDGSCLARARDAPCDCLGSCLFIHLVFHLSYIKCISQSRLALKQNKKSENDRRQCLMFTANREPRSFSLWLGVFTRYKKKSANSVRPVWAGQGCWHELQTQTTCAQGTKIIYRWSIAQEYLPCQDGEILHDKSIVATLHPRSFCIYHRRFLIYTYSQGIYSLIKV